MFEKRRLILCSKIKDPKAIIILGLADLSPCYFGALFSIDVSSSPQALFSEDVNLFNYSSMYRESAHKTLGRL